jgi:uncharacterized protein
MDKKKILENVTAFVKERLSKEGTGHDWWHIERVRNNAKNICRTEKADRFVIDLAVLLHDVGDRKVIGKDEDDYSIAENCLRENNVSSVVVDQVMFIIKNMSFSSSLGKKAADVSKEFEIVQDADRLDALGAIGIARVFAFGGSRARSLYNPSKKPQKFSDKKAYQKMESSSFHHFQEKILLLKDLLNTKTAKKIARARHKFLENYMKQFLLEWAGKR